MRDKSCAVEREVQTDHFKNLTLRGVIRRKPSLRQTLRKFKHLLCHVDAFATLAMRRFELQRQRGDAVAPFRALSRMRDRRAAVTGNSIETGSPDVTDGESFVGKIIDERNKAVPVLRRADQAGGREVSLLRMFSWQWYADGTSGSFIVTVASGEAECRARRPIVTA